MTEDRAVKRSFVIAAVAIVGAVAIGWLAGTSFILGLHFCTDVGVAAFTMSLLLGMFGFRGPWPWPLACAIGGAIMVPVCAAAAVLYEMIAERMTLEYPAAIRYSGHDLYAGYWWHSGAFLLGPSYLGGAVFLVGTSVLAWEIWRHIRLQM